MSGVARKLSPASAPPWPPDGFLNCTPWRPITPQQAGVEPERASPDGSYFECEGTDDTVGKRWLISVFWRHR